MEANRSRCYAFLAGLCAALVTVVCLSLLSATSRPAFPSQAAASTGWSVPDGDRLTPDPPRSEPAAAVASPVSPGSGSTGEASSRPPQPAPARGTGEPPAAETGSLGPNPPLLAALGAHLAAGQFAAAEALIAAAESTLGGHPARLAGQNAQAGARYRDAIGWYERALAAGLAPSHQVNVYERLGQSAEAIGDWSAAVRSYQQAGSLARAPAFRAEAAYREALNQDRSGDPEGARQIWAATALSYPATRYGARSLEALGAAGRDLVPAATRGAIYAAQAEFEPAVEAYTKAILAAAEPTEALELYYQRAYVRLRHDDPAALDDFRYLAEQAPGHPRAADALWHLARATQSNEEREVVRGRYLALAAEYPGSGYADDALVEAGLLAWQSGDHQSALDTWRYVGAAYPRSDSASRAWFWRGKVAAQLAGDAAGTDDLRAAAQYDDYYGYRARAALRGEWRPPLSGSVAPDRWQPVVRSPVADAEALGWLATWTDPGGSSLDLPEGVQRRPELIRGRALLAAGLTADAGLEVGDLAPALADRPADLLRLAAWLGEQGLVGEALQAAQMVDERASRAGVAQRPALLDRLIHPSAYADLMMQHGLSRGIDPAWFLALVRQESAFNAAIRSPAGARGLAQIMPATGELIARRLGRSAFDPAELDEPATAVQFGAFYLAEGLRRFDGDIMLALAAYNAGPGAVARWVGATGDDARGYQDYDLFVESIPYEETRTYVKKLYVNYYRYQAIYGGR